MIHLPATRRARPDCLPVGGRKAIAPAAILTDR